MGDCSELCGICSARTWVIVGILIFVKAASNRRAKSNEQVLRILIKNKLTIAKYTPQFQDFWRISQDK